MRDILAIFAAGLFLLHPLQTESVTYITGRSDVLHTLFVLAAFAVFVWYGRTKVSVWLAGAIVLLFSAACLTKENSAVFPAVLVATDLYWARGDIKAVLRRSWRLYAMLAATAAAGLVVVWRVLEGAPTAGFGMRDLHWYEYLFTQWRVVWLYFQMFFLPVNQTIDHNVAISHTILDQGAVFYLVALAGVVTLAWFYRRRAPLACFGLLVALLFLAPTSSFVPIRDVAVERRVYLPMLGLALVAVDLLRFLAPTRKQFTYAAVTILALSAFATYHRNGVWQNGITLWTDAVAKAPHKARTRVRLAYALFDSHRCLDASREFAAASNLGKPDYELLADWALSSECLHNAPDAIAKLRAAAAVEPKAHAYSQIGRIYLSMGLFDDAFRALDQAEKLDPKFSLTYIYRGMAHATLRQYDTAAADFQRALQIDPTDPTAQRGLADAQARFSADPARTSVQR